MSEDSHNHKKVRYYLNKGKVKSAIAYANGIEGKERIPELDFILSHCLARSRINDSVGAARMLGRELTVSELEQLSKSIKSVYSQNPPELLNKLRKTDNLPNPEELSQIFAPYVEYLRQQKRSSKS